MNELAQVIHDLVTRRLEPGTHLSSELSPEEHKALEDLRALFAESPSQLAAQLVQFGPTATWYGPPGAAPQPVQS